MAKPIVVIGSSNVDLIMKLDHLPSKGETVSGGTFQQTFGGKGANQAVAAGRAGGDVVFVSCLGDDPYAAPMVAGYEASGVRTDYLFHETGVPCGTALIMIGEGGENYISTAAGANARLTPGRLDDLETVVAGAAYVLMQFEIPADAISRALEMAAQAGVPVVWNYAPAKTFDAAYLDHVAILVVNEPEATVLSGVAVKDRPSAELAALRLRDMGVGTAIITLGADGSIVAPPGDRGETIHIPAFPVDPLDTTAAGDTYCGCLCVALAEGKPLVEAIRFASAAAAICVQRLGAQPSTPWREEIDAFLAERG